MNLFKANSEYLSTPKELKPFLVQSPDTGLYHVTIFFSKEFIENKGFKIIK